MVVYALWDLMTETLLAEDEDPAQLLEMIEECRRELMPEEMPMFGLTEFHPLLQAHTSFSGIEAVEAQLRKRLASRPKTSN